MAVRAGIDILKIVVVGHAVLGRAQAAARSSRSVRQESLPRALVNFGRAYIYSTEMSPAMAAGIEGAIGVMRDEPGRQRRVRELSRRLRMSLRQKGWDVADGESPIVPIIVGAEAAAMEMSGELLNKGFLVGAVRPPTVA